MASFSTSLAFRRNSAAFFALMGGWVFLAFSNYAIERDVLKDQSDRLEETNLQAAQSVEFWYKSLEALVENFAQTVLIEHAAVALATDAKGLPAYSGRLALATLGERYTALAGVGREIEGFFIIDKSGVSVASNRVENIDEPNLLNRVPGFLDSVWSGRTLLSPLLRTDVPIASGTGEECSERLNFFIATPVRNADGDVIAIFALRVNPSWTLNNLLLRHATSETEETYLVSGDGRMQSPSRFYLRESPNDFCSGTYPYLGDALEDPVTGNPILSVRSVNAGETRTILDPYPDYRGVEVIGSWQPLTFGGLGLVTEVDFDEAVELAREIRGWVISGAVAFTIIVLLLLAWFRQKDLALASERAASTIRQRLLELVGHEMRTPLNAIAGPVSLLEDGGSDAISPAMTLVVKCGVREMTHVVNRLEEYLYSQSGNKVSAPSQFDLVRLVRDAADDSEICYGEDIHLDFRVGYDAEIIVTQDRDAVFFVVHELVQNAFRHSGATEIVIEVIAKQTQEGTSAMVSVRDDGKGLTLEEADRAFEEFERIDPDHLSHTRGLGLGLSIAKTAVERIGGTLRFERAEPRGSKFILEFTDLKL